MLIPGIEVNDDFEVLDIHCQCGIPDELCVHTTAILLAAQIMMETDGADYHTAHKIKTGKALEKIIFLHNNNPYTKPEKDGEK